MAGGLTVFVFSSDVDRDAGYRAVLDSAANPPAISGVGEQVAGVGAEPGNDMSELVFVRCRAVVHVRMSEATMDEVTAYAQRIDQRLTPVVCQN